MTVKQVEFYVEGSRGDPYRVTFTKEGTNLNCFCTCKAGQHGQYCKHRFQLLEGETTDIVSDNADQLSTVLNWVKGSDVGEALERLAIAQSEYEQAQKKVKQAKRELTKAMRQ